MAFVVECCNGTGAVDKAGRLTGETLSTQAVYIVVTERAKNIGLDELAPHDVRRTFAKLAHKGKVPIEQIQITLGQSIQTTDRYLGAQQDVTDAPCDHLGLNWNREHRFRRCRDKSLIPLWSKRAYTSHVHLGKLEGLSARRSLSIFLSVVVCLACWQLWLTWRLMEQDRNLELQRSRERLEQFADLSIAQLAKTLGDWELALRDLGSVPPPPKLLARLPAGAILIVASRGSVAVYPQTPLLFVPEPPAGRAADMRIFDAADQLELRDRQYDRAIVFLQRFIEAPAIRPEALLRIGRIQRKVGQPIAALATYDRLAGETAINPSGTPYALLATSARYRIFTELGLRNHAAREAASLRSELLAGRWPIRREMFEYYWNELDRGAATAVRPPQSAVNLAILVSELYSRWKDASHAGLRLTGRQAQPDAALVIWNATPERLSALRTPSDWLNSALSLPTKPDDMQWKLLSTSTRQDGGFNVTRSLTEAALPGRIEFFSVRPAFGAVRRRRSLWLVGVVLMLMLVLVSGYAVHHGITQELRVARLKSDFVAAVSHEFRSPLTTLRSLTELLAHSRITDESRRKQSYFYLDQETSRLHRLVEDLLDFGRMESGRKEYRIGRHDVFDLVRAAVADFSEVAAAGGFRIETGLSLTPAIVQADEEAFRRVMRNLLENAMKYSPECRVAWVNGAISGDEVLISVRDHGMGIDPQEQRVIFQKFVRGDAARKAGIKGTGIGLAIVQQTLEAIGGEIRVQSSVGAGSTFTIVLPLTPA